MALIIENANVHKQIDLITENELNDLIDLSKDNDEVHREINFLRDRYYDGNIVRWSDISLINAAIGMKYADKLDWDMITYTINPQENLDPSTGIPNPSYEYALMMTYYFSDHINWDILSLHPKLSLEIIMQFHDKVNWENIALYNDVLQPEFIRQYIHHFKRIFTKSTTIPRQITYENENDECPSVNKPINGECVEPFPFKFKTMGGQDCCYKKSTLSKFKFTKIRNLDRESYYRAIRNKDNVRCPNLQCQVFPQLGCETYMTTDDFIHEIYLRSIPYDRYNSQKACYALQMEMPSIDWLYAQRDYSDSLSVMDKKWIRLYTHNGDRVLNGYLRGKPIDQDTIQYITDRYDRFSEFIPNIDVNNIRQFLIEFDKEISRIIRGAPVLNERIVVYRGMRDADFFIGTPNHIYTNKGYVSTSIFSNIALNFANDRGYINRIIIPSGYSCLVLFETYYENEFEILLPNGSMYYITQPFKSKITLGDRIVQMNECVVVRMFA